MQHYQQALMFNRRHRSAHEHLGELYLVLAEPAKAEEQLAAEEAAQAQAPAPDVGPAPTPTPVLPGLASKDCKCSDFSRVGCYKRFRRSSSCPS